MNVKGTRVDKGAVWLNRLSAIRNVQMQTIAKSLMASFGGSQSIKEQKVVQSAQLNGPGVEC